MSLQFLQLSDTIARIFDQGQTSNLVGVARVPQGLHLLEDFAPELFAVRVELVDPSRHVGLCVVTVVDELPDNRRNVNDILVNNNNNNNNNFNGNYFN